METKKVKFSELSKGRKFALIFALFSIVFLITIVAVAPSGNKDNPKNNKHKKEIVNPDKAWLMSQHFLESKLTSPATADFPSRYSRCDIVNDSTFWLEGYVDSQNAYGAVLRTDFQIKVMYTGGEWSSQYNWVELDFRIL